MKGIPIPVEVIWAAIKCLESELKLPMDTTTANDLRAAIRQYEEGEIEMYEAAHPETVTTKVAAFDPTPYLEEAERLDNDR